MPAEALGMDDEILVSVVPNLPFVKFEKSVVVIRSGSVSQSII